MSGSIDLLIMHNDSVDYDNLIFSKNIHNSSAIAMSCGKEDHIREINEWLQTYVESEEFKEQKGLFFRPFNPIKRAKKGVRSNIISPYDDLFKKYAKELGWDWRLLAALVYQESKFSISSCSHRGASGLMQVMPKTGSTYNITDLTDPEQNLIAGTSQIKRLQKLYRKANMTKDERIHFILAAYNAGEGRIKDCRSLARAKGLDPNVWANVVKVIPQSKFNGKETIAYVESVMNIYKAICKICPR
jgi:membrane-bound lytic murein transglycosylase F